MAPLTAIAGFQHHRSGYHYETPEATHAANMGVYEALVGAYAFTERASELRARLKIKRAERRKKLVIATIPKTNDLIVAKGESVALASPCDDSPLWLVSYRDNSLYGRIGKFMK